MEVIDLGLLKMNVKLGKPLNLVSLFLEVMWDMLREVNVLYLV
jgi:hypothetical protein